MYWTVTFNDKSFVTVKASWIIEAIVEACIQTQHSYMDTVEAAHILQWKG